MTTTKRSDSAIRMIEVISWMAIVPVMGMILTFIGGSIYTLLVIGH